MKIKIIKSYTFPHGMGSINTETIVEARRVPTPLGPLPKNYQILEGLHSGSLIPDFNCIELPDEPKLDHKLVVLPVKVAEAIEYYNNSPIGFTHFGIVDAILHSHRKEDQEARRKLEEISEDDWSEIIFKALVNGYTVETLESKISEGSDKLVRGWIDELTSLDDKAAKQLSQRITDFVTQIIREDGAAG